MLRFLEANGYDMSYMAGIDVNSRGPLLLNHKVFVSSGHDEYWSGQQRTNVEAARDAGVSLAFFSGNEVFWKTRWEPSIDSSATAGRTLVTYKETHYNAQVDPQAPSVWTGTWADPRFSPPGDGGNPPNALTGQYFVVNTGTSDIQVPSQYAALRLWRNTAVGGAGAGAVADARCGHRHVGIRVGCRHRQRLPAHRALPVVVDDGQRSEAFVTDWGRTVRAATVTHHLTLYRAASGALVFGAGTVQWSWGLDNGTPNGHAPDRNMQQATVNLFADMGAQPTSLLAGLVGAATSTDTTRPTSTITSPVVGANLQDGAQVTVSGTAGDTGGGVVAGVEVSTDGGARWHPATGTNNWSYSWVVHGNPTATLMSRAIDDSGNVQTPSGGTAVNVNCPCSLWGPTVTPAVVDVGDPAALELGVKFTSDAFGTVSGIRFYKAGTNTGTHIGNLWSSTGQLLATATFSGESASGWQQVTLRESGRRHRRTRPTSPPTSRPGATTPPPTITSTARAAVADRVEPRWTIRRSMRCDRRRPRRTGSTATAPRAPSRRPLTAPTTGSMSSIAPSTAPGQVTARQRHRRLHVGHGDVVRAVDRRCRDHVHRHALHRVDRPDAGDRVRVSGTHQQDRDRTDERNDLHLQGHGVEPARVRARCRHRRTRSHRRRPRRW